MSPANLERYVKENPTASKRKFLYNLKRSDYERETCDDTNSSCHRIGKYPQITQITQIFCFSFFAHSRGTE